MVLRNARGEYREFLPPEELRAWGRRARKALPRSAHGELGRLERDAVAVVEAQNRTRLPALVPLRIERMSQSPFTFYRGTAGLMARDLAAHESTGAHVVLCGDAHIGNFGLYASPERRLVFDLRDFDEAAPGPWEWDVKRMVTSVFLAALDRGMSEDRAARESLTAADAYRRTMHWITTLDALERFYLRVDEDLVEEGATPEGRALFARIAKRARGRTSSSAVSKLMAEDASGRMRFVETPPVLTHLSSEAEAEVEGVLDRYRRTVRPDVALLLSKYRLTDVARRVVGVGSVGTRCFVLALTEPGLGHIVLQVKEAMTSVVTAASTPNETTPRVLREDAPHGQRVVVHQQILQAVSDPFLGHVQAAGFDFYVRQFRDMKGNVDLHAMSDAEFDRYVFACGLVLARAHGQSPYAHFISGYVGRSDVFDRAITRFARAYAAQTVEDHRALVSAAARGRFEAAPPRRRGDEVSRALH